MAAELIRFRKSTLKYTKAPWNGTSNSLIQNIMYTYNYKYNISKAIKNITIHNKSSRALTLCFFFSPAEMLFEERPQQQLQHKQKKKHVETTAVR